MKAGNPQGDGFGRRISGIVEAEANFVIPPIA
jgi:hypothetical protein